MIDMLSDDVLLEIFDCYKEDTTFCLDKGLIYSWRWKALIQVCRRWRCVIFGSPLRLDLRIVCTDTTPTRRIYESLDIWPPFPISITSLEEVNDHSVENIIAALEHGHDRISHISTDDASIDGPALKKLAAAIQQPLALPALKCCSLVSYDMLAPVLPETFLGGSAPRLEYLDLYGIPFPTFPQFISSSTHIRELRIIDIPHSGYISPNAMVASLAALPNLKHLSIGFRSPLSRPLHTTPPPCTRTVLPALTDFLFHGASEYLEDFVAQIDTPLLDELAVTFFMDLIFDIPQLRHFLGRAERFKPFHQAWMEISDEGIMLSDSRETHGGFSLRILCERPDQKLSSMVQIFGQQLPLLSYVEQLEITQYRDIEWMDNQDMPVDTSLWLELFHLFNALQRLCVSAKAVPRVAAALQELKGERTMEVLPALHSLFLEGLKPSGPVPESINSFVAARQLSDRHVAVQAVPDDSESDCDSDQY